MTPDLDLRPPGAAHDAHLHVAGRASLQLPCRPSAVRRGRRFVADLLRDGPHAARREEAVLLTNELLASSVLHRHTSMTVSATEHDDWLQVSVAGQRERDEPWTLPRQHAEVLAGGLRLLHAVAEHWHAEQGPAGSLLCFSLVRPPDVERLAADSARGAVR